MTRYIYAIIIAQPNQDSQVGAIERHIERHMPSVPNVKQTKLYVSRIEEAFLQLETLLRLQKYQYYATISASIVYLFR